MAEAKLILLVGPSGSGKTTVEKYLQDRYGLRGVKSYTTRPPRHENEDSHTFITDSEFDALSDKLAVNTYGKYRYCTTHEQLSHADVYVVEPSGVEAIRDANVNCIVIYLDICESLARERMRERGDDEDSIEARITRDRRLFDIEAICPDVIIDTILPAEVIAETIMHKL